MKVSGEQIEKQEEELAEQEYQTSYFDLPGSVKVNIHNTVLEKFGMRRSFHFRCLDCGKLYEDMVEGKMVKVFSKNTQEILECVCLACQEIRDMKAEEEEYQRLFEKMGKML